MTDPIMFSEINQELLSTLRRDIERRLGWYLERILTASVEHGPFGVALLESLQAELPKTSCDNCGACCNAVSIFSLEYHRIIRDLMGRLPPDRLKSTLRMALHFDERLAILEGDTGLETWAGERRLRCVFRDNEVHVCRIHSVRPFACRFFGLKKVNSVSEPSILMDSSSFQCNQNTSTAITPPHTAVNSTSPGAFETRECTRVIELSPQRHPLTQELLFQLQERVAANSESFTPFPGIDPVVFFPFEFWLYKAALGEAQALRIYREILVPASTPLTDLWNDVRSDYRKKAVTPNVNR
ncbi:MAG: YkgJ family cysteine cluster protein [Candidatus Riflebacteria bacterium]|nr:YkgJ family cysteine cluster protein [Candidatus Riflebacteria bacterium]